jgi:hypothetical protein
MADVSPSDRKNDDAHRGAQRTSAAATPRWVKAFGGVALILALVFAALHLTGHSLGGHHHHEMSARGAPE